MSVLSGVSAAQSPNPCTRPPPQLRNGGLWEREHCGWDAAEASVEVTLVAGDERLVLSCRLDPSGQVSQRQVRRVAQDGTSTGVDPSATTWCSALAGHRPAFGYAAVERQVQLARNLQEFLEPLLGFGGCFEELKAAVKQAGAASAAAKARWVQARDDAEEAVAAIDRDRARSGAPGLPTLVWPRITDDADEWLAASGLTETGAPVPEVTEAHFSRPRDAAVAAIVALVLLETAETSLHARPADPLNDLAANGAGGGTPERSPRPVVEGTPCRDRGVPGGLARRRSRGGGRGELGLGRRMRARDADTASQAAHGESAGDGRHHGGRTAARRRPRHHGGCRSRGRRPP